MPSPDKFNQTLEQFGVSQNIIEMINEGFENHSGSMPKKEKPEYFRRAMEIMDRELPFDTRRALLEENGCCKGGAREKASKAFAKANGDLSLQEKLKKIPEVPYMGTPRLNEDGTITVDAVYFWDGAKFLCACPNYNKTKRDYPVSKTYCFCCAGHFKHHYEIMLGKKLTTEEILSSPLDSDGKDPCVIRFSITEK